MIINPNIRDHAYLEGFTRLVYVSDGSSDLTVFIRPDADLDSRFRAICAEEGDTLFVNGWMMCECDDLPPLSEAA